MTTETTTRPTVTRRRVDRQRLLRAAPWLIAVAAVCWRMAWATMPLGPDEAGFLEVAAQWGPGDSLYGDLWVDRPPLLVALFALANGVGTLLGGGIAGDTIGLRLVGSAAVFATIIATAGTVRRFTGDLAASAWAALVCAALLVSPIAGAAAVNGELLAAPFLALGAWGVAIATRPDRIHDAVLERRDRAVGGLIAGIGGAAAVLVKQNMLDVVVVASVVLGVIILRRRLRLTPNDLTAMTVSLVAGVVGAAAVVATVAAGAIWRGTSIAGVWEAMYPFRFAAAQVLADSASVGPQLRSESLTVDGIASGLGAVLVLSVVELIRRRRAGDGVLLAVAVGWGAWAALSIGVGGNFWIHYLVQLAVPSALVIGALAARREPPILALWVVTTWIVVAALVGTVTLAQNPPRERGLQVGRAIAAAAEPGDTIVVAWGEPTVAYASGLRTPYEHLWGLPVATLDPDLERLDAILSGPDAPTWFVIKRRLAGHSLDVGETSALLRANYRPAGTAWGGTILLRKGVDRPAVGSPIDDAQVERALRP